MINKHHEEERNLIAPSKDSFEEYHQSPKFSTPFSPNLSSENDDDPESTSRISKPHLFNVDERRSYPEGFEDPDDLKHKNTPLKSISTKTKESLSGFNKDSTPNKSLESLHMRHYGTIFKRKTLYQPQNQDSPALAI
jgi:hypothetical protein